ncbi:MAG: ATP-binding protein [Candidatus Eisenbacteria bacterium]
MKACIAPTEAKLIITEEALSNRVRELACLNESLGILSDARRPVADVLQEIANIIPRAFQYPSMTCARVTHEGAEFSSENFHETQWGISSPLRVEAMAVGAIDVYYLGNSLEADPGLFLDEERSVLAGLCSRIARFIEMQQSANDLAKSLDRHRVCLDNMPARIHLKNCDLVYVMCNAAYASDLQTRPGEIVGKTDYDFYPKEVADKHRADDRRVLESGMTEEIEENYCGGTQNLMVRVLRTVTKDEDGKVDGLQTVLWDITEHKLAIQAQERYARELAVRNRLTGALLATHDDEGYAEVLNTILEALKSKYGVFGLVDDQGALVVKALTRAAWHKHEVHDMGLVLPQSIWGDTVWPSAIEQRTLLYSNKPHEPTPEGQVPISNSITVPILSQGHVIAMFQVANKDTDYDEADINFAQSIADHLAPTLNARIERNRQRAECKLADDGRIHMLNELRKSNAQLEQFAHVAAHDLQEPLRMIASYTQLLKRRYAGTLDETANEFMDFAVDGATRMQRLINDLLAYSRLAAPAKALVPADLNISLGHVIQYLRAAIDSSGAHISSDPLPHVLADGSQLEHLLSNLVSNAIKFRRDEQPTIHVSAHEGNDEWVISVEDNGIGFQPDESDRIFLVFKRLHTREEYPGTGIGLSICKKIVEYHGGRIWAESEPGKGSTFWFTIPQRSKLANRREDNARENVESGDSGYRGTNDHQAS